MPKAQKMNIQYVLTVFKKKFEWQMQLKLPRGDENVLVNLLNIKPHEFMQC